MRAANITAGIAVMIWLMLAFLGCSLTRGIVANNGQIIFYIGWPLLIVAALLTFAWVCNTFPKWVWVLGLLSGLSLFAVLPWLVIAGGGI